MLCLYHFNEYDLALWSWFQMSGICATLPEYLMHLSSKWSCSIISDSSSINPSTVSGVPEAPEHSWKAPFHWHWTSYIHHQKFHLPCSSYFGALYEWSKNNGSIGTEGGFLRYRQCFQRAWNCLQHPSCTSLSKAGWKWVLQDDGDMPWWLNHDTLRGKSCKRRISRYPHEYDQ